MDLKAKLVDGALALKHDVDQRSWGFPQTLAEIKGFPTPTTSSNEKSH